MEVLLEIMLLVDALEKTLENIAKHFYLVSFFVIIADQFLQKHAELVIVFPQGT